MNICVCIKQVPDTNEIKVDPVTHTLVRKGVPSIVNPFDTYAQEVGVRLKEKLGGKVVVISMGPEQADRLHAAFRKPQHTCDNPRRCLHIDTAVIVRNAGSLMPDRMDTRDKNVVHLFSRKPFHVPVQ